MRSQVFCFLLATCLLSGCKKPLSPIVGLWEITEVQVGEEAMTPNARWARFYADGTQESGNGWLQHSTGTYTYMPDAGTLTMQVVEGLEDEFGDFSIAFPAADNMQWTRQEGEQSITVDLRRIQKLPRGYTDEARGLWQLAKGFGENASISGEAGAHLFLRWDGRFFDYRSGSPTLSRGSGAGGVYNVHGHRPEIEFIPYDPEQERSWWTFTATENQFSLELLNSEVAVTRVYRKVTVFPK